MKGTARALRWLTDEVHMGEGAYTFSLTEDGDVGLFLEGAPICIGVGDSAEEALLDAHRKATTPTTSPTHIRAIAYEGDFKSFTEVVLPLLGSNQDSPDPEGV